MGFLEDVQQHFGTDSLYEVLAVDSKASSAELKKAYRKMSLKHHPDKFQSDSQALERQTIRFQLLAKIHKLLSDDERRAVYDEQGVILDEDGAFEQDGDWNEYWRRLFPKITRSDIDNYMQKYLGSEEELQDLKKNYERHEGDMNLIFECQIGFEEDRTRSMIEDLIAKGELQPLAAFVKESAKSRTKRRKRLEKENAEAEQVKQSEDELILAIQQNRTRREQGFDSMIAAMEAKYGGKKDRSSSKRLKK